MKNIYAEWVLRFLSLLIVLAFLAVLVSLRSQIITAIKNQEFAGSPVKTELLSQDYLDRILATDGRYHPEDSQGTWFNQRVSVPMMDLAATIMNNPKEVLGDSTGGDKWIDVDLNTQRLRAYEGNRVVYDMAVSTGLPWLPTVTGTFNVWAKVRAQRMIGGSVANGTYYDLPNVPFVQFFHGGYSLHGTYWHHDFGKPRSHGCVNLSIIDAEKLYYWTAPPLQPGEYARYQIDPARATRIVIHGSTPTNIY